MLFAVEVFQALAAGGVAQPIDGAGLELANALGVKWDTVAHMGRRLSGAPEWTARLAEAMTRLRRDA